MKLIQPYNNLEIRQLHVLPISGTDGSEEIHLTSNLCPSKTDESLYSPMIDLTYLKTTEYLNQFLIIVLYIEKIFLLVSRMTMHDMFTTPISRGFVAQ